MTFRIFSLQGRHTHLSTLFWNSRNDQMKKKLITSTLGYCNCDMMTCYNLTEYNNDLLWCNLLAMAMMWCTITMPYCNATTTFIATQCATNGDVLLRHTSLLQCERCNVLVMAIWNDNNANNLLQWQHSSHWWWLFVSMCWHWTKEKRKTKEDEKKKKRRKSYWNQGEEEEKLKKLQLLQWIKLGEK